VLAPLFIIGVRGGITPTKKPITISNAGDYTDTAIHTAAVLNTPFSIIRTFGKSDFTYQKFYADYNEMENVYSPVHCPDSLYNTTSQRAIELENGELMGKNIVMLILEGFNYENMKFLNASLQRSYTPFLDSLTNDALVCTNAFANGRKSIDAIPSLFISVPSLIQSYAVTTYSTDYTYGLPKILDSLGYHTAFLHGAPNTSMGIRAVSRLCGIKDYYGKDEYDNDEHFDGAWGIWDEHFLQFAAEKIGQLPQPFFANVFTLSSHHPFLLPDEYKDIFNQGNPRQNVIEYTDMALRK
jgi:phosphoglycerol transferase MdoB-like AlkP superfamily enzyme